MAKRATIIMLCVLLLTVCFTGCNDKNNENGTDNQVNVEGKLEDLIQKMYDNLGGSVELPRGVANITLSEDMGSEGGPNIEYYIGAKEIPFTEGVASESSIGSAAYSVVLLRMEDGADIEAAKKQIKDNVDPAKWICVRVDESNVVVDNIGNLVVLIMSEDSEKIHESFLNLNK